jgi:hypothetical protein
MGTLSRFLSTRSETGGRCLVSVGWVIPPQLNEGIAVNPLEKDQGPFYVRKQPNGDASSRVFDTYVTAKNVVPTLWMTVPLSNNHQAWGMAFDSKGRLYVTGPCQNDVAIYSDVDYSWTYSGNVAGTFSAPLFLTVNNDMLAIPSSRGPATSLATLPSGTSQTTLPRSL